MLRIAGMQVFCKMFIFGECKTDLKLEQLERLRSEDTLRRLMITHTIESYWIQVKRRQSQSYKF